MKYKYGLSNYILHELGINLDNSSSAINNEDKKFRGLNESERIDKEINKIKKKYNKNNYSDEENIIINKALNSRNNIKEIIVCLDLIMEIEVSFKTTFIVVVKEILIDKDIINMLDNEEFNPDEMDKSFRNCIFDYINNIVNSWRFIKK